MTMQSDVIPDAALLADLRANGWSVAVHNDYRLNGEHHTFWLFTHPSGRWAKGEGRTDSEALEKVALTARLLGALTGAPDPDIAALCERLRDVWQWDNRGPNKEAVKFYDPLSQRAADRLESLSREIEVAKLHAEYLIKSHARQLSDAQRERDELRAAVSEWLRYRNSMLSGDCDTQAGEYAAVKKLESMVKHTEGGKP